MNPQRMRVSILIVLVTLCARSALASFHLWKIDEVYSNASGTVQYIELMDAADGENFVGGHTFKSNGHTFTFPTNLPSQFTAGHHMLLATPGYFKLRGVPQADFNLGVNNFFVPTGDTLDFSGVNSVSFSGTSIPTDGIHSAIPTDPPGGFVSNDTSPANFNGDTADLPRWENQNNRLDVDNNGSVQPLDALLVINELLRIGGHTLPTPTGTSGPPPYYDVDGDRSVFPSDALNVINHLIDPIANPAIAVPLAQAFLIVPEPSSVTLALVGVMCVGLVRVLTRHAAGRGFRSGQREAP